MEVVDEVKDEMENLVEMSKNGDKNSYSKLIVSIQNDLYKVAYSRLKNSEDCKDAVQETIINAYLGISKLKNNKSFKTWITKILINECNRFHARHKRKSEIDEKYANSNTAVEYFEDNLDFDTMIDSLDEKEKTIFRLRYEDGLSVKQIANRLKMNENTIKTILSRGRNKIKKVYKPATILTVILCVLVGASVIAVSIISYIQSLFDLDSMGKDNSGVLTAIEHLEWFQKLDIGTIDFGNGYKLSPDYLLMDEMNLYMVLDIESENDISKVTDISFPDLKVVDESGNVICDRSNALTEQYSKSFSVKIIECNNHTIKLLIYMYTDSFPTSKVLDISLSKIEFLSKSFLRNNNFSDISGNSNFRIELSDKFINRSCITYSSESPEIEKAIITETGFYAILESNDVISHDDIFLFDESNIKYRVYTASLTFNDGSYTLKYIAISDFKDLENNNLRLVNKKSKYTLIKE